MYNGNATANNMDVFIKTTNVYYIQTKRKHTEYGHMLESYL